MYMLNILLKVFVGFGLIDSSLGVPKSDKTISGSHNGMYLIHLFLHMYILLIFVY